MNQASFARTIARGRAPRRVALVAVGLLGLVPGGAARAERIPLRVPVESQGYERIAWREGVAVFKHRTSNVIKLAAEARFEASPERVERVLLDYRGQIGVIARLSESHIQARGANWLRVYQRLNLPVIDDRDFTLRVDWGKDGETRWITYRALPNAAPPPRDGVVRLLHHEGSWQLQPLDGGRATYTRFMVSMSMGGMVPMWMARSGSAKEMPALFTAVRTMLNRSYERRLACSH